MSPLSVLVSQNKRYSQTYMSELLINNYIQKLLASLVGAKIHSSKLKIKKSHSEQPVQHLGVFVLCVCECKCMHVCYVLSEEVTPRSLQPGAQRWPTPGASAALVVLSPPQRLGSQTSPSLHSGSAAY